MIKVSNLNVDYGDNNGIFDINMTIADGEICAVIGHSGCGKTTLLNTLAGLLVIDSGEISITNQQNTNASIGLVQQKDALFPWLRAYENVGIGIDGNATQRKKMSLAMLDDLCMQDYYDAYPFSLSGGQRQRISIARTLVVSPDILLMDEPTASLDAFSKEALQDLLLTLHLKKKRTTLFVTHSIEEALFLANTILIMDKGKIILSYDNPLDHNHFLRDSKEFYEQVKNLRDIIKRGIANE